MTFVKYQNTSGDLIAGWNLNYEAVKNDTSVVSASKETWVYNSVECPTKYTEYHNCNFYTPASTTTSASSLEIYLKINTYSDITSTSSIINPYTTWYTEPLPRPKPEDILKDIIRQRMAQSNCPQKSSFFTNQTRRSKSPSNPS